ncbi:hypothetical protein HCN44_010271 [Aphidius gifuensis]|uniref:Peptidase S1 domain-containing protein n=1 Tax=Aphidius gifuensis TaxID=684658 RepID=A0A834XZE7_APHGI|nr:hypothetical protein HCN44_010271 [Aphidius gifuensis]
MWITILYIISLNILISVTNGNFQEKNFIRARIQDHPYQVSIQYKNYHICGGAVLSNFFILTAASCLSHDKENVLYANLKVLSGTDNLEKLDLDSSINDVEYVILHKKFDLQHQRHDIAILRLTRPLIFNLYRWTVSSPYDYKMFTYAHNTGHYITGWGKNSYTVENSTSINPRLQFVWVDLTKPGDCEEYIDQHCLKAITTPLKSVIIYK